MTTTDTGRFDDMIGRADLSDLPPILTNDPENPELPQPAMVVAVSPDGEQVVPMTRKAFTTGVGREGWTELDAEPDPAPRSRNRRTTPTTPAPAGGDT